MPNHDSHHSAIGGGHIQSNERRVKNTRTNSRDENLALFSNIRTQEHNNLLHPSVDDIDASLSTKIGEFTHLRNYSSSTPPWKSNDLLARDAEKNDYDWLLTPPATPLFPSLGKESPQVHVQRRALNRTHSTSNAPNVSRPVTREIYNSNQCKRPSSSAVPSTNSRNIFTTEKMARPTSQMSIEPSNARQKHLDKSNFRSSSTEKYAPPKGRGRDVSLSPRQRPLQKPGNNLLAKNSSNLRITRTQKPRSSSQGATLRSRPGDTSESRLRNSLSFGSRMSSSTISQDYSRRKESVVSPSVLTVPISTLKNNEIVGQRPGDTGESRLHNSLSFGSRMSSSTTSQDYSGHKESVLSPSVLTVPISTLKNNKIAGQRLDFDSGVSHQDRQSKGTPTKGHGCSNTSAPKSRERSTPSKDINCISKYSTANSVFKPSINTTSIPGSAQDEKPMSNDKSIDGGEKESEENWKQTSSPKTARKADAEMSKKHVIWHTYKDQTEGVSTTSKTSSPGKDIFRNQNTCDRSDFKAFTKKIQPDRRAPAQRNRSSFTSLYERQTADQACVDIQEDLTTEDHHTQNQDCGFHNLHRSYLSSSMMPEASKRSEALFLECKSKACPESPVLEGRLNDFEAGNLSVALKEEISKRVKRVMSLLKSVEDTLMRKEENTCHGTAMENQNVSPLGVDGINSKVAMILPSEITLANANESSVKENLISTSLQQMPTEGFHELVHKKLADEENKTLVLLERVPQSSMKKPQFDILEPTPMHVNTDKVGLLALRTRDHEGQTVKAIRTNVASLEENGQASHREKVNEFITESPPRIKKEKSVPTWALFSNQVREQLQKVRDHISSFRREVPITEELKVEHNEEAKSLEKSNAVNVPVAITQHPTLFDGMKKSDCGVKIGKLPSHVVKGKSPIKQITSSNCQCSVM